jgi:hypothetical protein
MPYYTAVLFAHNWVAQRGTFTTTREVQTDDLDAIVEIFTADGRITKKYIDTILLLKNGKISPEVIHVWSRKSGHFLTEQERHMSDQALHIDRCMSPEERKLFLDTFCRNNPHYRGAHVADVLSALYDSDSEVGELDAMYKAHKAEIDKYPTGLYSMTVYVAIYTKVGTDWEVIRHLLQRFGKK